MNWKAHVIDAFCMRWLGGGSVQKFIVLGLSKKSTEQTREGDSDRDNL